MNAVKQLKQMWLDNHKKVYPNIPSYARVAPKFTDSTANGLTRCIITWCELNGCFSERTGNEGRVIDGRKTYKDAIGRSRTIGTIKRIPSSGTKGTSDIKMVMNGRAFAVEVKIGKDRQSEVQKMYQKKYEATGGIYLIARTFDDFLNQIKIHN